MQVPAPGALRRLKLPPAARATSSIRSRPPRRCSSRRGPIGNLVVYGHAAPNAVFMREDLGFYTSVDEIARSSRIVDGTEEERIYRLRADGIDPGLPAGPD